ncbi:MAG: peroxiredoxin [Alsobacter sp.]
MIPPRVPDVVFHTRVRNPALGGDNPFEWKDVTTADVFGGKRVVLFGVPGAFTPACSDSHLPGYERNHAAFAALGIDSVVCTSVNDAFVMFQWARSRNIENVFMLPDGNGDFARRLGLLVERTRHGMGMRSWRYSMLVEDGAITASFLEPEVRDNPDGVGLTVSDAETMLAHLRGERP